MNIFTKIVGAGISVFFGDEEPDEPKSALSVSQSKPRKFYVYAHLDEKGTPFYIGKGTARRAWDKSSRHDLWRRYLNNHLSGKYTVKILADNMDSYDAELLENEWIAKESKTLVNWVSSGRETNFEALKVFHRVRNSNKDLATRAKDLEKIDLDKSIDMHYEAFNNIKDYAHMKLESGLVGQLLQEEKEDIGLSGEIDILNRLTVCLNKAKRKEEALEITQKYFEMYKRDAKLKTSDVIKKRVGY